MPARHGKITRVVIDTVDLSTFFSDMGTPATADTAETSTFQNTDKTYLAGMADGQVSLSGFFDGGVNAVNATLQPILGDSDNVHVFTGGVEDLIVGRRAALAQFLEAAYGVSGGIAAAVGVTATLQAIGGLESGVVLHGVAAAEAFGWNGLGTTVDEGATGMPTAFGGVGHLHVIQNTLNQAVVIKSQHSSDNSVWVDLGTHPNVGAATKLASRVAVAGNVNRYLRTKLAPVSTAPTSGTITYAHVFARRYQ